MPLSKINTREDLNHIHRWPSAIKTRRRSFIAPTIFFAGVLTAFSLTACSSQGVYEAARQNRLQDCEKYEGSRREQCLAEYQKTYPEYERQREEVLQQ